MKTYLTAEEFANLVLKLYERKIEYSDRVSATDRIVSVMFSEFESDVKETLEGSLWGVDQYDGPALEYIGPSFHKSFRQCDPIPNRYINGIIWNCLTESPLFWKSLEKACKILSSEEASDIYKDEVGE